GGQHRAVPAGRAAGERRPLLRGVPAAHAPPHGPRRVLSAPGSAPPVGVGGRGGRRGGGALRLGRGTSPPRPVVLRGLVLVPGPSLPHAGPRSGGRAGPRRPVPGRPPRGRLRGRGVGRGRGDGDRGAPRAPARRRGPRRRVGRGLRGGDARTRAPRL